ncbi:MAG: VWA domain-containing protein [Bacillota bacterium]|nr:VWA domain-containing protein [Bacillota bacterium]
MSDFNGFNTVNRDNLQIPNDVDKEKAAYPLYIVFVVDATASMASADINASRFSVAEQMIRRYLDVIFAPAYSGIEKHIALVSFGNGARVHVIPTDGMGKFASLINPNPAVSGANGLYVADYYIGASEWSLTQPMIYLKNYNSVKDKTLFFYSTKEDILKMLKNISRYDNTNCQSGIMLAHELLAGVPFKANKVILFITDGESTASSNFFAYYNQGNIPARINSASIIQTNGHLFVKYKSILAETTDRDLICEGIDPDNYNLENFTSHQIVALKLRALSQSKAFFKEATAKLSINPFAGEWHNFDATGGRGAIRVPVVPNLFNYTTLSGYYWSNGHIGFAANYYYHKKSPHFVKSDGIWKYSQTPPKAASAEPVYNDEFWQQSIAGQKLDSIDFDNSQTELMLFSTDQKIAETRMIDYYEHTFRKGYASNAAKKFMIDAAVKARGDGILIEAIGTRSDFLLPEYLDKVASSETAYIMPKDADKAIEAFHGKMTSFMTLHYS